jgi:hypothetical protein
VVGEQAGYAIDATTVQITTKAYVAEIRQRLDEAARSQRRHKPVPKSGNTKQGMTIALDVEQLVLRGQ